jgi:ABC-type antimicrobial peptide transport system permease subunit
VPVDFARPDLIDGRCRGWTSFNFTVQGHSAPTAPAVFAPVAGLLAAVAFVARYLPARRAARRDPVVSLRCE